MTVPFPLPLDPPVMITQLTLLEAVHVQPALVTTEILPGPPPALAEMLVGRTV
jgi:hypothetical protein